MAFNDGNNYWVDTVGFLMSVYYDCITIGVMVRFSDLLSVVGRRKKEES